LYYFFLTASLTILQVRIDFSTNVVNPVTAEGVATVQVGGDSTLIYYFACSSTDTTNGMDLVWSRMGGTFGAGTAQEVDGATQRLNFDTVSNSHLGVYICTDTTTGEYVELNITSGKF